MKLKGIAKILLSSDDVQHAINTTPEDQTALLSDEAHRTLVKAAEYQLKASDTRLATQLSIQTVEGELNRFQNITKAQAVKVAQKTKRDDIKNLDTAVRMAATLWSLNDSGKMSQVSMEFNNMLNSYTY